MRTSTITFFITLCMMFTVVNWSGNQLHAGKKDKDKSEKSEKKKKKEKKKEGGAPKNARYLTFDELINPVMQKRLKKQLAEEGNDPAIVDQLRAKVMADTNFKCMYFWTPVGHAQVWLINSAKINGISILSEMAIGEYWQALKSAGASFAAHEELVKAKKEAGEEITEADKIKLTPEQIAVFKNLDDAKKKEIGKARAYRKVIRRARIKMMGNVASLIIKSIQIIKDTSALQKALVIKPVKYGTQNLKAAKANRPDLERNEAALDMVEEALEEAGIELFKRTDAEKAADKADREKAKEDAKKDKEDKKK